MSNPNQYPTEFVDQVTMLPDVPQAELNAKGLYVVQGLTVALAEQLAGRSQEEAVSEYCGNDYIREDGQPGRFYDVYRAAKWLAKGRLALPLIDDSETIMGMGWMGPEKPASKEKQLDIPGAEKTFAIRLYQGAAGDRNSAPYTRAIVAAHQKQFGVGGEWLEAWGDNVPALASYTKIGFNEVDRVMSKRHGKAVERVYMTLGKLAA